MKIIDSTIKSVKSRLEPAKEPLVQPKTKKLPATRPNERGHGRRRQHPGHGRRQARARRHGGVRLEKTR